MASDEARGHTDGAGGDQVLRVRRFLKQSPHLCGTFSVAVGLMDLVAWWLGRPQAAAIFSGLPTMTANTAVMAILAGTSLILVAPLTAATARVIAGQLCAAAVASIAGLTLAEHILSLDFGIDRLLIDALNSEVHALPERPAIQTAGAFGTIAAALIALDRKTARGRRPAEMLALLSGIISLIALLGHLFRIAAFYGPPTEVPFLGVSIPTAFVVFALSAGILAARADEGILSILVSRDSGGIAARRLMTSLAAFVPVVCILAVATRIGALGAPMGTALIVLVAIVGGATLFLSVSQSLSRLDAERSRVEAQLRTSQERLELALGGAEIATWDWNVASGTVTVNERWTEMRGEGRRNLVQDVNSWIASIHPDDRPRVQKTLADHLEGRVPEYQAEHRLRTMSRGWIWILTRGRVSARDEQGRPIRMVGTALDITSRKRLEEEQAFLAEAGAILGSSLEYEETLTSIARFSAREFADLCAVDLAEEGGVQRLKTVTRDPSKAWIGDLVTGIRIDRTRPHLTWTILETKRSILMETVPQELIESWSGIEEYRRVLDAMPVGSIIGVPLLAHGHAVGTIWLVRSKTSPSYGPSDLRLAEALAERAALAIENARHYRAAQRAVEARDSLMGIVAHDLRNPLGSILMQTAMLRRIGDQPERRSRKPVESIERGARRMNRLIQDLLDVTSLEANRLSIQQARVDPGRLVTDAVEAQTPLADAASLTIECHVEPDLPEVWADRERLLQVFENLIGNAIKFTPPGGHITVSAQHGNADVLFRVSDTGEGIDATSLPHLFERFWQGPGSRRHGAGLGLPIVKGIVEAHKGRIWAESEPEQGSTFFFTIPAAQPTAHVIDRVA